MYTCTMIIIVLLNSLNARRRGETFSMEKVRPVHILYIDIDKYIIFIL